MVKKRLDLRSLRGEQAFFWLICLVFLFYLIRPSHYSMWRGVYSTAFMYCIPGLLAAVLWLQRGRMTLEEKLYVAFLAWLYISRALNGDYLLNADREIAFEMAMAYVFFSAPLILPPVYRRRFLDLVSWGMIVYFTFYGLLAISAVLERDVLYSPFNGRCIMYYEGVLDRIVLFGRHSTFVVAWYLATYLCSLYQISRQKRLLLRLIPAFSTLISYAVIGLTFSRSGELGCAFATAMLIYLLLSRYLPIKAPKLKLTAAAVLAALSILLVYKGLDLAATTVRSLSSAPTESAAVSETQEGEAETDTAVSFEAEDQRGLDPSGRLEIYLSIIPTFREEPMRMLRGCLYDQRMSIANQVLPFEKPNFHNSFLDVLGFMGLPGLLLALAFTVALGLRYLKFFFSPGAVHIKVLGLMLVGILVYSMFEETLFTFTELRTIPCYVAAGAVLAWLRDQKAGKDPA